MHVYVLAPKEMLPSKWPATTTSPPGSPATPFAYCAFTPPKRLLQRCAAPQIAFFPSQFSSAAVEQSSYFGTTWPMQLLYPVPNTLQAAAPAL
ncbi:MAG: hypothetical protein ACMG6S_26470, partial [Byssovorax sp.]